MVNRKQRSTRCARNRMQGGGLGNGFHLGAEMLTRGYAAIEPYSSCGAMSRPGVMSTDVTNTMPKGLPGLAGGGKRRRGTRKGKRTQRNRKQRGGRYDMVMSGAEFSALGPRGGMMATAMRAPCEAGQGTPLASPTQITAPAFKGGAQLAPAPFLQEQTAGYTQMSSKWLDSVGAPVQIHEAVGGRMGTPACGQTGGKRSGKRRGNMRGGEGEGEGEDNTPNPGNTPEETARILAEYAENVQAKAAAALALAKEAAAVKEAENAAAREAARKKWLNEYQTHMIAASGGAEAAAKYASQEAGKNPLDSVVGIKPLTEGSTPPTNGSTPPTNGSTPPTNGSTMGGRRKNRKASRKQRKSSRKASRKANRK